jgi:hypothetical protein
MQIQSFESEGDMSEITIRIAAETDTAHLERLAALDSTDAPRGRTLVAEVDGELVAALPVDGNEPIGDPFHRTAELLRLLELRKAQITRADGLGRSRLPRLWFGALRHSDAIRA